MTDKVQKILSEIATRKLCTMDEHMAFYNDKAKEDYRLLSDIEEFIKALQEEPVSQDLEEAAWLYYDKNRLPIPQEWDLRKEFIDFFKAGAQWQKEHLWKPAEWSEDDEQYLLVCKNALRKYEVTDKWDSNIISQWLDNKLKCLRPRQWKPSEEQIMCLQDAIDDYHRRGYKAKTLGTLLEQLKQL